MKRRFILAPEAADDLMAIWRHIRIESSLEMAERVEEAIRARIVQVAKMPGIGHERRDLTKAPVRFFPVYSYLIVYRTDRRPVQIVGILHGRRDIAAILKKRM